MAGELWRRSVDDVVEVLGDAKGECVVLIGAGCSFSAGIPLAGGLIREISEKFPAAFARAKENGHHRSYNTLMRALNPKQRRKLLHGHIEKARINWAHLALAQLFKNEKIDRVLTVNFDPLLVRACALVGYYPAIYDLATASYFDSAVIAPNSIFYLNGQHTGFAILNADDELDPHRERLREIVKDTGTGRTWIVVGYSGDADPLLEIIAEHQNFGGGLYWVGHADDPSPELKEKLLQPGNGKTKNAFYLGGQDADKFFLKLAQALEVFPPKIIENPFVHVRELLENIDFETGDDYVKSLKPKLLQQLDHCESEIKRKAASTAEDSDFDPVQALLAGRYQEVLAWYSQRNDPSEADKEIAAWAYVMIGNVLAEEARALVANDLPEARLRWGLACEKYAAALAIKPDMHEALNNWGGALDAEAKALVADDLPEARRRWALAGEKYAAALAIKPDKYEALNNLSTACLQQWHAISDPQEKAALLTQAKAYSQQVEALVPGEGAYNLACCHALETGVEECLRWLDVADQHQKLPDREHLQQDRDLDPVRETPPFQIWWQARFPESS